jgi:hypothetical protein
MPERSNGAVSKTAFTCPATYGAVPFRQDFCGFWSIVRELYPASYRPVPRSWVANRVAKVTVALAWAAHGPRMEIPKDRIKDLRYRIKQLTTLGRHRLSLQEVIDNLNPLLLGWGRFYQHCYGAKTVFSRIDHYVWDWIRRWLRKKFPKTPRLVVRRPLLAATARSKSVPLGRPAAGGDHGRSQDGASQPGGAAVSRLRPAGT